MVSNEKVYKECNNEAFYYRGAPAGLIAGGLTTLAAMNDKIKPGRFGFIFKILATTGVAFILGKLSYGELCTQKFLQVIFYCSDTFQGRLRPWKYDEDTCSSGKDSPIALITTVTCLINGQDSIKGQGYNSTKN